MGFEICNAPEPYIKSISILLSLMPFYIYPRITDLSFLQSPGNDCNMEKISCKFEYPVFFGQIAQFIHVFPVVTLPGDTEDESTSLNLVLQERPNSYLLLNWRLGLVKCRQNSSTKGINASLTMSNYLTIASKQGYPVIL